MPLKDPNVCCSNSPFHASARLTVAIVIGITITVVGMLEIMVTD